MAETPLMIQYREFKKQYADKVLFFRLGDFYEMFDEDAVEVSSLLNLTLTHRGESPMCGIPYHAAKNYIRRLLDYGKKIVICEQIELSDSPKSLAKREIVRIITPATVVDEDFLDERMSNYILAIFQTGFSYCDISTGEFHIRKFPSNDRIQCIREVINQISPKEIVVCEDEYFLDEFFKSVIDNCHVMLTKLAPWYFSSKKAFEILCNHFNVNNLSAFGIDVKDKFYYSAGALLRYIQETSKNPLSQITNYSVDDDSIYMSMDESSRKNLELFTNLYDGSSKYSLCESINRCKTTSGYRLLKNWISFPLKSLDKILDRQNWVEYFYSNHEELDRVRLAISSARDMTRLVTRIIMKKCVPHDLVAISQSISSFLVLVSVNPDKYSKLFDLQLNNNNIAAAVQLMNNLNSALNDQFLGQFNSGEVIKENFDSELDSLRNIKSNSDLLLKNYLEEEKKQTGISILKLGYNRVFGYFIEVPNGQKSKVPDYFLRKQTLVNGERFTTLKLQEFEKTVLEAGTRAEIKEKEIYESLCDSVLSIKDVLVSIGDFLSKLDVFQGLATLAIDFEYCKPEITNEDILIIKDGRHPVVEQQIGRSNFVCNNLDMNVRFSLITGPNMAGKSTFLRQNALIVLLSHIGSFVPASYARIGIVDKLFCRVGATDNLARGESTFLIEMQESAYILRNCTDRSFVIVDEIGRGTSTQDGMSIAYAVMKELIRKNAKTLFATHYHELTYMDISGISLRTLSVSENNGDVIFLRKVIDGVANSSYGIHVAKMAGIPSQVIKDAKSFQSKHFADYTMEQNSLFTSECEITENINNDVVNDLLNEIKKINVEECTPVQALILLSKLKEKAGALF